jgi:NTP pyrophosphatase (non-canonical NTP hydrolase)
MNIPELIKEAHETASEKGFYDCPECGGSGFIVKNDRTALVKENAFSLPCPPCNGTGKDQDKNIGELLMLIVSELGEALEAHRSGRFADWDLYNKRIGYLDKNEANRSEEQIKILKEEVFLMVIKDTFEDEIADVFIRLFDLCGYMKIPIEKHIKAKMAYNKTREKRHGKRY